MASKVALIPSASRLMSSLRDIGYDIPTSIADLVDNSIAADATEVDVDFRFEDENSWVRISDNGNGMSTTQLEEALRYGTNKDYNADDLGKFGLGLKTASLSHCMKLVVASRQKGAGGRPAVRIWDLDHVKQTDRWEAINPGRDHVRSELTAPLDGQAGTVVMWERLDRASELITGPKALSNLATLCRQVEQHLGMVFHRFISGSAKRKLTLEIRINGNVVSPWDPFAMNEHSTKRGAKKKITISYGDKEPKVYVQSFILPAEKEFSTSEAHTFAGGPRKWNQQQGFYVYRNDRMIQSGGWNRFRSPDEHTKLARISVDFSSDADEAFEINIAKMRVQFPSQIRGLLEEIVKSAAGQADARYRRKEKPRSRIAVTIPKSKKQDHDNRLREILNTVMMIIEKELRDNPTSLRKIKRKVEQKFPDLEITSEGT